MNNFKKATLATSLLLLCGAASASNMYIDLGSNVYDANSFLPIGSRPLDANTATGIFDEFGFSQLLATSLYEYEDGSILGTFKDTNTDSQFLFHNIPTTGASLGGPDVTIMSPDCAGGQCDIDALSPLAPPLITDNEGFLQTWDIQLEYTFNGTLGVDGPNYTGGTLDFYFNDFLDNANDRKILTATVTKSELNVANLDIFFDITMAEQGWLYIDNGSGTFIDAYDGTQSGNYATMVLDTNVNPPIPTSDQLLVVTDDDGKKWAIRQSTLDGSITSAITSAVPEPGTIAIMGLGLLGLGAVSKRRRTK